MNNIVPPINLKGTFKLKPPLNTLINEHITYTVDSIKTITSYLVDDINIERLVYLDNGLTSDDYKLALDNEIVIVTLKSEGGSLISIPADYFSYIPQITGKIFKNKTLIVNLGYVPTDLELDYLVNDVNDYVKNITGFDTGTTIEDISGELVVSYQEYDIYETDRLVRQSNTKTCRGRLAEANNTIAQYKEKVKTLLKKIRLIET